MTSATSMSSNLLEYLHEISRFNLQFYVYDVATIFDQRAWIAICDKTMLIDINGRILVQTPCRKYGVVTALSNGDALYTPSGSVISRIDQIGQVSTFIDLASYVTDILAVKDDVFVAVEHKISKLDLTGRIMETLDFDVLAVTSMPGGNVAAIDRNEMMVVIRASDCRVLHKDIKVTIASGLIPVFSLKIDRNCRIIRGHGSGTTIHVFQMEGEKVTRIKDYTVDRIYNGIYAVDTDDSGNLWIGTSTGDVIVTKYCQYE